MAVMAWVFDPLVRPMALPLATALVVVLLPRRWATLREVLAVAASAVTVLLAWPLFAAVRGVAAGQALTWKWGACGPWLRADALNAFVVLAATGFGFLIALYSAGAMRGREGLRGYYGALLATVGLAVGALLANDLLLVLVFWGLLGLTLYLMIGLGGPDASAAAKKSFIIVGGSDCFLMLGIVIFWRLAGTTRLDGPPVALTGPLSHVAFLCFAVAAFAKAGAMPLHSWVPDCGEKAPAAVTAFLPASLDKLLGIYLLARTARGLFVLTPGMQTLLMVVGAGTVVCAVMMALVQHDLKRLLAYHAVSQVGYMVLGIGTGTALGIAGGLFHMLNNAIYKSALFLGAGNVEKTTGTTDMDRLGGLGRAMPLTFVACLIASLAIAGVPPLNGFASKWMVYQGILEAGRSGDRLWVVWLAAAMFGSALTLASFVKVLHAVFLCKPAPGLSRRPLHEVAVSMWLPMLALAGLCVLFGVRAFPVPLRTMILPAVGSVRFTGVWWAGRSTLLLVAGWTVGLLLYLVTTARKARECETYIGGELMSEPHISGVPRGPARHVEVTGVDFYLSVEELGPLRRLYAAARKKWFDLYDVGTGVIFYFVELLRSAHSGLLPLYLTWYLAGFLALLWWLANGARLL